jgi:hypothetical protein
MRAMAERLISALFAAAVCAATGAQARGGPFWNGRTCCVQVARIPTSGNAGRVAAIAAGTGRSIVLSVFAVRTDAAQSPTQLHWWDL